jgi:acetone carboxylase gamma subunit
MGIYTLTLRAATKVIDGVEIGHYGFAFKNGWDWHYDSSVGSIKRRVRSLYAKAEAAAHKNRNVRHFIGYEFSKIAENEPAAVYATSKVHDVIVEEIPGVLVGHIHRNGRKLSFVPIPL